MKPTTPRQRMAIASLALAVLSGAAQADEGARAFEPALASAQQDRKGVTLLVAGQQVGGAVTRIQAGQWVELRNQQHGRIIVRLDRIDALLMP
jgi:hypothetical protein